MTIDKNQSWADRKAEEYAQQRCKEIFRRRFLGLEPSPIRPAISEDFLAAVRAVVEWAEGEALGASRTDLHTREREVFKAVRLDDLKKLLEKE